MNTYGYGVVQFSQDTRYDQNSVKLCSSSVIRSRDGETALLLELENISNSLIYVTTSDIAINGLVVNSSTWSRDAINPGKRHIVEVMLASVLDSGFWSAYGINGVGSISLSLGQRSADGAELAPEAPVEVVISSATAAFDRDGTELYNNKEISRQHLNRLEIFLCHSLHTKI